MNNFAVNIDGKEYWISRSVAVCCLSYNETLTQAVVREIFEETGFKAKEERLQFVNNPSQKAGA